MLLAMMFYVVSAIVFPRLHFGKQHNLLSVGVSPGFISKHITVASSVNHQIEAYMRWTSINWFPHKCDEL